MAASDPTPAPQSATIVAAPTSVAPAAAVGSASAGPNQPTGLLERIEAAVKNLVILRVTTVVGTVTAAGADDFNQVTALAIEKEGQQVASTSINMVLGDCSLILSPIFVDNAAYKQLQADAVAKAIEVRAQTIALLKTAYETFKDKLF